MSNLKRDPSCEDCKHYVADAKYHRAPSYGRCHNPKGIERGAPHFTGVNRAAYGLCAGGKLFEAKGSDAITV
jgi:hypothetical protein